MAAATEQVFAASPTFAGGSQIVQSPFQFVADADTFLRVVSACSVSGITIALQGRRLDDKGQLQVINETHTPNSNRTVKTQDYILGPGAVLNLAVFASAGAPLIGQCYVQVQILRNFGGVAIVLGTLIGGVITNTVSLGFPGSPVISALEVEPVARTIVGTQPAVGAAVLETVPTGARWELVTFRVNINASVGNVPAINFDLFFNDALSHQIAFLLSSASVGSGNTSASLEWLAGYQPPTATATAIASCMPAGFKLLAGSTLNIGGQANNQYTAPIYNVREWLDI